MSPDRTIDTYMRKHILFIFSALLGASSISLAIPTKDPCFISIAEQERITEFVRIKEYLKRSVFAPWESVLPPLYFYDSKCQFVLNQSETGPEGFVKGEQVLNVPTFTSTSVYYRPSRMKLPMGDEIAVKIMPAAKTVVDPQGKAWTVMALFPVWKSEFGDRIESYYGMLAHESFHPFQYKYPKVKAVLTSIAESDFNRLYQDNVAYQTFVEKELSALKAAILAQDQKSKRKNLKVFFETRRKRRDNFFTADKIKWSLWEPGYEAVEGVAEYLNFRMLTDAKKYKASFRSLSFQEALTVVSKTKSHLQKLGVYQVILLNQLSKNWQARVFEEDRFLEGLLQEVIW